MRWFAKEISDDSMSVFSAPKSYKILKGGISLGLLL